MDIIIGLAIGIIISTGVAISFFKLFLSKQQIQFEQFVGQVMNAQSEKFVANSEKQFSNLVNPINKTISEYKHYIDNLHREDLKDRESLREKINSMLTSAFEIERQAGQLSKALSSDVKVQGQWGEFVLERILEISGLTHEREFSLQISIKNDEGKQYRPDAVIFLPENRHMIIDSKASLTSYFDYINGNENALIDLKKSITSHINQLGDKKYYKNEQLKSPEFVFMFIPIEGVFSLLIKEFPELIEMALQKQIVLASPLNLIASLKTVSNLWRLEYQTQNSEEIAKKAGAMYDKFVLLVSDLEKVYAATEKSLEQQNTLLKRLKTGQGNLMDKATELKELGAKTSK